MTPALDGLEVLFIAGFGPVTQDPAASKSLYVGTLGLPLRPHGDNTDYAACEDGDIKGVRHFAVWPLEQAAQSCFGQSEWPTDLPVPQAWLEFDVADIAVASGILEGRGYRILVNNREEPWGQKVTRFVGPEGLLLAVTETPWLRA